MSVPLATGRGLPVHVADLRPDQICSILDRVVPSTGCWEWTGPRLSTGYGRYIARLTMSAQPRRSGILAHRALFEIYRGPIHDGMTIDHLCGNRGCVNPNHLEAVTMRENTMRSPTASTLNALKTHCDRGHPLSGPNLCVQADGARRCRECRRMNDRKRASRRTFSAAASSSARGFDAAAGPPREVTR